MTTLVERKGRDTSSAPGGADYYRSLLENVLDIVSVLDADGKIRYHSPSIERVLGYTPDELNSQNAFSLVHPHDVEAVRAAFRAAFDHPGEARAVECRFRHKDGSWRVLESEGKSITLEGRCPGLVVNSRDITERKRAEEQVQFHASLLDHVCNAVIAVDTNKRIIYWNRFAEQLYGWNREEVLGRSVEETIIPPSGRKELAQSLNRLRETGYSEGERLHRRKDLTTFPASVHATAIRNSDSELIGFIGVTQDISGRKQAEDQLRTSREQLRRLAERLESVRETERALLAREIHDQLGQMLTALKLELAQIGKDCGEETCCTASVAERVERLGQMIDTTIDSVQRLSAELRPSLLDELGLAAAIEWQAHEFETRTGVHCVFEEPLRDSGLRPAAATAIFRIFQEVLTNVARHARASNVRISLRRVNRNAVLDVRDDGRGISAREVADPHALGLLGISERATLLGGDVRIEGAPGKGTTVTVRIPLGAHRRGV